MLKMICLEWKKNNIKKYIRNAIILLVIFSAFMFAQNFLGIASDPGMKVGETVHECNSTASPIELFTSSAYLVFTGVMLASFIVSSYKNKTMNLMFSYPIKRQKIIISQILSVWIFGFVSLVLTKLFVYGFVMLCSKFMVSDFLIDFSMTNLVFYIELIIKSAVTVSVSFIALFVGLIMKSSKATIVTSCLLIFLLQGTIGNITLADNKLFPIILIAISVFSIFLFLKDVENRDLM